METFQIRVEIDERIEQYEVKSIGDAIENSRYELYQHDERQAEVWTETSDEGLVWHTEDVMDEGTLEKIGHAIEKHEL